MKNRQKEGMIWEITKTNDREGERGDSKSPKEEKNIAINHSAPAPNLLVGIVRSPEVAPFFEVLCFLYF